MKNFELLEPDVGVPAQHTPHLVDITWDTLICPDRPTVTPHLGLAYPSDEVLPLHISAPQESQGSV